MEEAQPLPAQGITREAPPQTSDEPPSKRVRLDDSSTVAAPEAEKKPREKIRGTALIKEE
jgi:hypothetical protein